MATAKKGRLDPLILLKPVCSHVFEARLRQPFNMVIVLKATGGVLTDWETTAATWDSIGFPIVEGGCHD
jgi:hypothetical protein